MDIDGKMRIALVGLTYPFRGGISHYTSLLCRELRQENEVRFFALKRQYPNFLFPGESQKDPSGFFFNVSHDACLDSINPLTWFVTFRKIRRFKPDLILFPWWHPFFAPSFGSIAFLCKLFGRIPSCYICHNVIPHERSFLDKLLLHFVFSSGDVFITHSLHDHDELLKIRPHATVHRNHHPSYEIFAGKNETNKEDSKNRFKLSGKKVLLFFGYIREYKGLEFLLRAMELLNPEEGYHLLVVGEFYDDKAKYRTLMDKLLKKEQLTVIDQYVPNEDVSNYFSASDIVIVPYIRATQSGVIQIAYGFLKPVIATRVGGIPEVVIDEQTGYLVPPADPEAIAAAVQRYFNSNQKDRFRKNIIKENKKYSWDHMIKIIEKIGRQPG